MKAIAVAIVFASTGIAHAHIPNPLQGILHQVASQCVGFRVISGFRRGARVAGTRRPSLHASNRAIDFRVHNYSCAYRHLRNWHGGLSLDPWRVHHIHISFGGHEGRFYHGGGRRGFARHRHRRHWR